MRSLPLIFMLFYSVSAFSQFSCFNPRVLNEPLILMNLKTEWVLKSSTGTCETLPVPVEVPSENYEGWQGLEVIEDPGCSKMGEGLFDQNRAVKRVELAPTLLNGKSGFLKIVYENLSEYGPETIKTFLRCRVED